MPQARILTIKKQAPNMVALAFTSRSIGTAITKRNIHKHTNQMKKKSNLHWIPKLSASVKNSLASPDHCLLIFPTGWVPSADMTCDDFKE